MEDICEEIMDFQKKGRYDLMYQKAQQFGGKTSKVIRKFGIKDNQGNVVTAHRQAFRMWENMYKICIIRKKALKTLHLKQKRNCMKIKKIVVSLK